MRVKRKGDTEEKRYRGKAIQRKGDTVPPVEPLRAHS
jgi:hypothetical protein